LEDFDTVDLQALTIYLSLLQHMGEARAAWLLTGTLVRVAVSMGLHRKDSDSAGLSVFKVESRRRLWWQICILDSHAKTSQFCITADSFDTEMPLNLDDANCGLAVSQSPVNLARWTDTTPLLIRSEVWKLSQALRPSTLSKSTPVPNIDDMDQKLTVLQRSQEIIEDNYLKYADTNNPLHCFVTTSTRLFLIKVDLILYTKRFSIEPIKSREARALHNEKIFTSCVSIINYTYTLLNEPTWVGWRWQIRGRELPWQALRIVLKYLLTQSWAPNYEQAWSSTKRTLDSLSSEERTDPRYLQLSYLANKVQRNRWNTINHQEYSAEPTNTNISTFTPLGTDGTLPAAGIHSPLFGDIKDSLNDLDVDIDWQTWDDFMGGLEPSFDLWDMGGL
jgi:hypothetical protein